MSVFSKMYGYPTGYFNTIYKYLLNQGQIKTENDLIQLVKDFGYPEEIVNRLAQEVLCTDGINMMDVVEDWDNQLQLEKKGNNDTDEMGYKGGNYDINMAESSTNNSQQEQEQEYYSTENESSSSETEQLNSEDE